MKNSTRRIVNHLSQYIGLEIIRTNPVVTGKAKDFTFTTEPILLLGFTPDGEIRYSEVRKRKKIIEKKEGILPLQYTDRRWITYKKALKSKGSKMRHFIGKKITRVDPVSGLNECPFVDRNGVVLLSASKYHIVVLQNGKEKVLGPDFTNPEDWVEVGINTIPRW